MFAESGLICDQISVTGKVIGLRGPLVIAALPLGAIGDWCRVHSRDGSFIPAQIVGFEGQHFSLAPLETVTGLFPGAKVSNSCAPLQIEIPCNPLGLVCDALGYPLNRDPNYQEAKVSLQLDASPPCALERVPIREQLITGIRLIDAFLSLGCGQRIGLFSPAGLGKSTLLGMLAGNAQIDCIVIALVGERGREVREFLDDNLGSAGLKRAVVVVSTSDECALKRSLAAITATSIAEHLRDQGKNVLLLVDSLTRAARAVRDVSLAAGEMPIRQGMTSSVYQMLPRLLERAGKTARGSITAIYTVLVNSDHEPDPLGEEIKSILDGHIVLDHSLWKDGIKPSIDLARSVSRLSHKLLTPDLLAAVDCVRSRWIRMRREKEMLLFGAEPDTQLKRCLELEPQLRGLIAQDINERAAFNSTCDRVKAISEALNKSS